ncbi:hypothetical protein MJO28_005659 [Puccinia striiformis f. sp. tritici]|uniref:Uncharacterized protein n=1 Tax=Puccinia striiformis f. sp. tritici TaxID=168172 RepID=A0ACC0ELE2_9BASI|nr:hypothetical protein Pst134EB_010902 [Puccinia striiformis f. sp. tritici]KAI7955259.1 hypothetical protein MJO28_005659 [Puccinia striiformis f. sp. tritici]KAI7960624.1 hypothetical protein MJO29_005692 [Puccinia striiformis f. sp. tritici]KAI9612088.1 hypothetical protein H4Q26_008179 [Puccinia striiformis f. sp. tritici PST-130]
MNSLTWLLAPRPGRTKHPQTEPQTTANKKKPAVGRSLLTHSPSSSTSSLDLGTGPRETEAELVDKMVYSIERRSGSIAANTLERKTSMGLDGELRFGLPGITERRRTLHLDPGPTPNHIDFDSGDLLIQPTTPTPPPSTPSSTIRLSDLNPYPLLRRLLPVRLAVKLYILICKFLSLFDLHHLLSTPDSSSSTDSITTNQETKLFKLMWSKLTRTNLISKQPQQQQQLKSKQAPSTTSRKKTKTLVLDLDETLIHSTSRLGGIGGVGSSWSNQSNSYTGLKVRVVEVVLDGRIVVYHVYKRPWVDFFLKTVSTWYTVVIFTASMREYADPVIDWLDQGRGIIDGRLFRESCTNIKGAYVKDLSMIENDLSKVCLVDNCPISYGLHQSNGIPIEGWLNDPKDEGLLELLPILDSLRFTKDVRRILGLKAFKI